LFSKQIICANILEIEILLANITRFVSGMVKLSGLPYLGSSRLSPFKTRWEKTSQNRRPNPKFHHAVFNGGQTNWWAVPSNKKLCLLEIKKQLFSKHFFTT